MNRNFNFTCVCFFLIYSSLLKCDDILMTAHTSLDQVSAMKSLSDTVMPYPISGVFPDGTIQQGITNRMNKVMPPGKTQSILVNGKFSVLHLKNDEFKNFPAGTTLFGSYKNVAASFDAMINVFLEHKDHVAFIRKIHINALHALYHYLMSIYVNFNMQHVGIQQNNNGQLFVHVPLFIKNETEYAANKKTLIINHLINIVQSQFNNAFLTYVPNLPQMYACYLGKTLIQNDYSIDLSLFASKQLSASKETLKLAHMQSLVTTLNFYKNFTDLLLQNSTVNSEFTAFEEVAELINTFLYQNATGKDQYQQAVAKMNPPIFTYTYDDIRALKLIPFLAKSLPATSKKIGWPEQIVVAAQEGILVTQPGHKAHPLAYFRTSDGVVVQTPQPNDDAELYVSLRTGQNLFEERLISEPDWLSSWTGIVRILRACFGDSTALVGLGILDPLMEYILTVVQVMQKGGDPATVDATDCLNFIANLKQKMAQNQQTQQSNVTASLVSALPNTVNAVALPINATGVAQIPVSSLPVPLNSLSQNMTGVV